MNPREQLLEKVIDLIYGVYDPNNLSPDDQNKYISSFKERLIKWKIDPGFRKIIGPLQPSVILSKMVKVPVDIVEKIAQDMNIELPQSIDMREFNIQDIPDQEVINLLNGLNDNSVETEQNILEILASIEKNKLEDDDGFKPTCLFEYVDLSHKDASFEEDEEDDILPNSFYMIKYLEGIIEKIKTGHITTISVISLLNDGKASVYLPPTMSKDIDIYNPVINLLRANSYNNNVN